MLIGRLDEIECHPSTDRAHNTTIRHRDEAGRQLAVTVRVDGVIFKGIAPASESRSDDLKASRLYFDGRILLVVDDEPDIRDSLQTYFQAEFPGLRVLTAGDASQALSQIRATRIDVAVVDYRMPRMNGVELLKEIRSLRPDLPSILVTAFPDVKILSETWNDALAKGFLTKPMDLHRLRDLVARLLAKRTGNLGRIPPSA